MGRWGEGEKETALTPTMGTWCPPSPETGEGRIRPHPRPFSRDHDHEYMVPGEGSEEGRRGGACGGSSIVAASCGVNGPLSC